jgi:signal transduction histidine kinase
LQPGLFLPVLIMSSKDATAALLEEVGRLQQSSNIFLSLLGAPDRAIAILSMDRRLVWANDTLSAWFPLYDPAGPAPLCHLVLKAGSGAFCTDCPALRCMASGNREAVQLTLLDKAGMADFRVSCRPLYDAGHNLLGVLVILENIGESAQAEKAMLQHTARLEEKVQERTAELTASQQTLQQKIAELDAANRELKVNRDRLIRSEKLAAVGEMSATVAHGLRNPLVSIGGFARRLLKKQQADEVSAKYLQIIIDEIDRLEVILSELLDFVRPRRLELKSVYLGSVVEEALQGFSAEFVRHGIQVQTSLHPGIPALEIDVEQFRRVLQNLFCNSIDAMSAGGVLHVTTCLEDGQAKISIADTGRGIDDGDIEKVFHPFYTSKPSSAGLGLAVCNQIIAIHGGHIKLQRRLPLGVVFDIYLPLTKPEAHE